MLGLLSIISHYSSFSSLTSINILSLSSLNKTTLPGIGVIVVEFFLSFVIGLLLLLLPVELLLLVLFVLTSVLGKDSVWSDCCFRLYLSFYEVFDSTNSFFSKLALKLDWNTSITTFQACREPSFCWIMNLNKSSIFTEFVSFFM